MPTIVRYFAQIENNFAKLLPNIIKKNLRFIKVKFVMFSKNTNHMRFITTYGHLNWVPTSQKKCQHPKTNPSKFQPLTPSVKLKIGPVNTQVYPYVDKNKLILP